MAQEWLEVLEGVRDEFFPEEKGTYPFTEWEKKRETVKERLGNLSDYVEKAASTITITESAKKLKKMELKKKTMLFLFMKLTEKSNKNTDLVLGLLGPLLGFEVNYKDIERLYSDEEVKLVLRNLFCLLVQEEEAQGL